MAEQIKPSVQSKDKPKVDSVVQSDESDEVENKVNEQKKHNNNVGCKSVVIMISTFCFVAMHILSSNAS